MVAQDKRIDICHFPSANKSSTRHHVSYRRPSKQKLRTNLTRLRGLVPKCKTVAREDPDDDVLNLLEDTVALLKTIQPEAAASSSTSCSSPSSSSCCCQSNISCSSSPRPSWSSSEAVRSSERNEEKNEDIDVFSSAAIKDLTNCLLRFSRSSPPFTS